MAKLKQLLAPSNTVADKMLVDIQTATTRVKELITSFISQGKSDEELTKELNKTIAENCKAIKDKALREQFRKSLVSMARKIHYQVKQTYDIASRNIVVQATKQPLDINIQGLLEKTPYNRMTEFRRILDDGNSPAVPIIRDYIKTVRTLSKSIAVESPKIVTRRDGQTYVIPARLRAELAVRYSAAVENLQELIASGELFCMISSHPDCSPRCAKFQGKLYSLFTGEAIIDGKVYKEIGTIDGIPYRPINEALAGSNGDGNGCLSGYGCRHRGIAYRRGMKPPQDFSPDQIRKEYVIDKKQRAYENSIRRLKTEEVELRASGLTDDAKRLRKRWRKLTKDYEVFSVNNNRAFYPYRCIIDRNEEKGN